MSVAIAEPNPALTAEPPESGASAQPTPAPAEPMYDMSDDVPELADPDEDGAGSDVGDSGGSKPGQPANDASASKPDSGKVDDESDPFTAEILEQAQTYGFTAEEARDFGSPAALERAMIAVDRKLAAYGRTFFEGEGQQSQQGQYGQQQPPPQQQWQPEQSRAADPQADGQQPSGFEKFKIELNPDDYDPDTINLLNGLNDHYDKIVRQQQQQIEAVTRWAQQITGRTVAEDAARFDEQMDRFFTGLGEEFREVFGSGTYREIKPNSPEQINRLKLLDEMAALRIADERLGRPQKSLADLQQRALRSLYGDKIKTSAAKEVVERVANTRRASIERPTGRRNTKPSDPVKAAGQFADRFYREKGMFVDAAPDEI